MVPRRQPGRCSADLLLWAWVTLGWLVSCSGPESCFPPICSSWLESSRARGSTALGLSRTVGQSASLGLCVGQLASAPSAHPPEVSGVGGHPGFQVWAPSPLIWVCATGLQVRAGAAYPTFTVQGLRGEGCQRWLLLQKVL